MAALAHPSLLRPDCMPIATTPTYQWPAHCSSSPIASASVVRGGFWSPSICKRSSQLICNKDTVSRITPRDLIVKASGPSTAAAEKAIEGKVLAGGDGDGVEPARVLYPAQASYKQGSVKVSDLHTVYYEVFGNPKGKPVVFLHGGPGAGCYPNHSRFFDLAHYRVLLFDQRGCGRSTPRGCLDENTTWSLVSDIEKLRQELGVEKWLVCGGSWGVTLALAYAQSHPERVAALVLRGVCMLRRSEIDWFYKQGASSLFPFGWEQLLSAVDESEHGDLIPAFYKRLTSGDSEIADQAARAWLRWEMGLSFFQSSPGVYAWDGKEYRTIPSPLVGGSSSAPPPGKKPPPTTANKEPPPGSSPQPVSGEAASSAPAAKPQQQQSNGLTEPSASVSQPPGRDNGGGNGPAGGEGTANGSSDREAVGSGSAETGAKAGPAGDSKPESASKETGPDPRPPVEGSEPISRSPDAQKGEGGAIAPGRDMAGSPSMSSMLVQARLECHYFLNRGFLEEGQLLAVVDAIRGIPCIIVQGRYDFVCPIVNAFDLHRAWPEAELRIVPNAGHSMYEPGIVHELVGATDRLRSLQY